MFSTLNVIYKLIILIYLKYEYKKTYSKWLYKKLCVTHNLCTYFNLVNTNRHFQNIIIFFYYYTFLMIDNIILLYVLNFVQLIILTNEKCE